MTYNHSDFLRCRYIFILYPTQVKLKRSLVSSFFQSGSSPGLMTTHTLSDAFIQRASEQHGFKAWIAPVGPEPFTSALSVLC